MNFLTKLFKRAPDLNRYDSLIGTSVTVIGNLSYRDNLRIDGEVDGNIRPRLGSKDTVLLIKGVIHGNHVEGETVVIEGFVRSPVALGTDAGLTIKAKHLKLEALSIVIADFIEYETLEIVKGARLDVKNLKRISNEVNSPAKEVSPLPETVAADRIMAENARSPAPDLGIQPTFDIDSARTETKM